MENGPFEDASPIENGGFPFAILVYQRVVVFRRMWGGGFCWFFIFIPKIGEDSELYPFWDVHGTGTSQMD